MEKDENIQEKVKLESFTTPLNNCAPQPTPEQTALNQPLQIQNTAMYQPQPQMLVQQPTQAVYPQGVYPQQNVAR